MELVPTVYVSCNEFAAHGVQYESVARWGGRRRESPAQSVDRAKVSVEEKGAEAFHASSNGDALVVGSHGALLAYQPIELKPRSARRFFATRKTGECGCGHRKDSLDGPNRRHP